MQTDKQRDLVKEVCQRVPGGSDFLYSVSFDHPKEGKVFGKAQPYDDDAPAQAEQGRIIIHHAVFPYSRGPYAVKAEKITPHKGSFSKEARTKESSVAKKLGIMFWGACPHDDYESMEQIAHDIREERNTNEDAVQVNDIFRIPLGDGHANYVITAVNGSRCTVEWRGLHCDDYYDHHFGSGGTFSTSSIKRYVCSNKGARRLFRRGEEKNIDKPKLFAKLLKEYEKNHGFPCPVEL